MPGPAEKAKVPVALIPRYALSLSDSFASTIPINDAYAPVDHWQWTATLWRGVVGADVTVYIKDRNGADTSAGGADAKGKEAAAAGGAPVEVRLADARAIVVRRQNGHCAMVGGGGGPADSGIGEAALRRVGFEVGEWVRGMGGREGV